MHSMTGFGRGEASDRGRTIVVELKSVNHRYLDLGIRLPRSLVFLEECLRSSISARIARGHIDVFLNYQNQREDGKAVRVDEQLLEAYLLAGKRIATQSAVENDLKLAQLMVLPGLLTLEENEDDREAIEALCLEATARALDALLAMRLAEGGKMREDMLGRTDNIRRLLLGIEARAPMTVESYRDGLRERIGALLDASLMPDETRLANELAIFADRVNIDEEIVRVKSHCEQLEKLCDCEEPCGRQFDFIIQEVNRELNTIGSKASDIAIANIVIEGKTEVEKLREQVQNIE